MPELNATNIPLFLQKANRFSTFFRFFSDFCQKTVQNSGENRSGN
jgi:hypothetical protein